MIREHRAHSVFDEISIGANKAFDSIKSILKDKLYQISLTTCDANQHVKVIERIIRFVTERIQVVRLAMLYTTIPKLFTIEMIHQVIILMNLFHHKGGLHSVLSPRKIVTGNKFRCPKIQIGQYIQGLMGDTNDTKQEDQLMHCTWAVQIMAVVT